MANDTLSTYQAAVKTMASVKTATSGRKLVRKAAKVAAQRSVQGAFSSPPPTADSRSDAADNGANGDARR